MTPTPEAVEEMARELYVAAGERLSPALTRWPMKRPGYDLGTTHYHDLAHYILTVVIPAAKAEECLVLAEWLTPQWYKKRASIREQLLERGAALDPAREGKGDKGEAG